MGAGLRTLRLEARHSLGLWLAPVVAVAVWYLAVTDGLRVGASLWPYVAVSLRQPLVLVGPFAAGLAAWAATRERRRGVEELLATTPRPAFARDLANWGALTAPLGAAYLAGASFLILRTYLNGAWGSPILWPLWVAVFALVAHSAVGYAIGHYAPSRFTAPLVAIVIYGLQGFTGYSLGSSARYLSPLADSDYSVFFGVLPNIFLPQSLWLLGLAGVALAAVALGRGRGSLASWGMLLPSLGAAAVGAALLLGTAPGVTPAQRQEARVPFDPVCKQGRITVCVHPAYRGMLPGTAAAVNEVSEPLAGLPGLPGRAEQRDYPSDLVPKGTLPVYLPTPSADGAEQGVAKNELVSGVALALVQDAGSARYRQGEGTPDDAQAAVAYWLVRRTGNDPQILGFYSQNPDAVFAAGKRFAKLPPEERRRWLRENLADLRAGRLTLKDLP
jgi:hypothetical protein